MDCYFTFEEGGVKGANIMIDPGRQIIGHSREADMRISQETVSGKHAVLILEGGVATLEDMSATNPTQVNGSIIAGPARLSDGDLVRLGGVVLKFNQVA